jgi:hypothetical protein
METANRLLIRYRPLLRYGWAAVVILLAGCDADDGGGGY